VILLKIKVKGLQTRKLTAPFSSRYTHYRLRPFLLLALVDNDAAATTKGLLEAIVIDHGSVLTSSFFSVYNILRGFLTIMTK
jgi:hypothetical protein